MTPAGRITQALDNGALTEALDHARELVAAGPDDQHARHLYIDLLVLAADYEQADAECSEAVRLSPGDGIGFAMLRNQLRAMAARKAWFDKGAVPEFPHGPTERDKAAIRLNLAHRAGGRHETRAALDALEALRGERPMIWNGQAVADFRDLDDRVPHALEVIMTGGAYLWVDFSKIAAIEIEPLGRPRDLAFRRATLSLTDGASASVLLPVIYGGTAGDETLLLGRATDWVEEASGITTGRGQRCFLAGDELVSLHGATTIAAAVTAGSLMDG